MTFSEYKVTLNLHCAVGSVSSVGKLNGDIFKVIDRGQDSRNGIWNGPTGLILLSAYSSIYLNVEGHELENKTHVNIQYEGEKMVAASVYLIHPASPVADENRVS